MKKRGFTLMELLVVIACVLIISALGFVWYSRLQANNAVTISAQIVASDLKFAKDMASMSKNGAKILLGVAVSSGVQSLVIQSSVGAVIRKDVLPAQATVQTSWGNNSVNFNQNGSISNFSGTGTITISNKSNSLSKQIQVNTATGAVL
jgi:prepilin-type N-terminal cleavage/methylation domain-containing protein